MDLLGFTRVKYWNMSVLVNMFWKKFSIPKLFSRYNISQGVIVWSPSATYKKWLMLTWNWIYCFQFLEIPVNKLIQILVGFTNNGKQNYIIENIHASLRYPQDFSYYIQNVSRLVLTTTCPHPFPTAPVPHPTCSPPHPKRKDKRWMGRLLGALVFISIEENDQGISYTHLHCTIMSPWLLFLEEWISCPMMC